MPHRRLLAAFLIPLALAVASAGPSKPDRTKLKAAIADAHKAEKKGDHAAAAAAYERAVALQPENGRLLSELGWQHYQAKNLPRAEEFTRRAIAAKDGRVRAGSLYNLGKILEAKGDKAGAVKAYSDSLDNRPNRTVFDTLARLDKAAASAADPLRPKPLSGPFPALSAWCAQHGKKDAERCPNDSQLGSLKLQRRGGPWLDAKIFDGDGEPRCSVAVRTEKGWFVRGNAIDCYSENVTLALDELSEKELLLGAPAELVLRIETQYHEFEDYSDGDGDSHAHRNPKGRDKLLMVCGLGPSKVPSCFRLTVASYSSAETDEATWQLSLKYGAADVEVTHEGDPNGEARAYIGKHPLVFP